MSKELNLEQLELELEYAEEQCNTNLPYFRQALKALTPPTEQEVCEALEKYLNEPVWVDKFDHIRLTTQWAANKIYLKNSFIGVNLHVVLPPHLITMIGKFYEGKVKE